jgi:hypothetical protein
MAYNAQSAGVAWTVQCLYLSTTLLPTPEYYIPREKTCHESHHRNRNGLKRDHSEVNSRMKGPESDLRVSFVYLLEKARRDDFISPLDISGTSYIWSG